MNTKKIFMVLADGFEETEAIAPADIFRRLGFHLMLVGLKTELVRGAHDIFVKTDVLLKNAAFQDADAIVLPGGLPGATNLRESAELIAILQSAAKAGKVTAAICAAPIVLARAGLTDGKRVTGYPGTNGNDSALAYTGNLAEVDGMLVTGKGPGAVFAFAAQIAKALGKTDTEINELYGAMFITR